MSVSDRLVHYLEQQHVPFVTIPHARAYTAQEIAASIHVPGQEVAKTVIVQADGKLYMAVMPATRRADLVLLKKALGVKKIRLATEEEFEGIFPECEVGAMPPFGNLYRIPVVVDESLKKDREIVFNAGSHTETVKMGFDEFVELVKPIFAAFTERSV
ncbi:MAG TPA: YbaK/EbsC family protein [Thermoanaerobaculia bacterium]|nr:YbaK/EbsC family protein [Thermoanaerobaculia bacterium]HQR66124.1 YbaK/EbsC family protein [Thermoanaerobaculia bacterium]